MSQNGVRAAGTSEAIWMLPEMELWYFTSVTAKSWEAKGNPFTETMCNFLFELCVEIKMAMEN